MDQNKLGKFIALLRTEKGLTQEQLGEILNVGGKTISKWECGSTTPSFETMIIISKELDVSLYELSIGEKVTKHFIKKSDLLKLVDKNNIRNIGIKRACLVVLCFFISMLLLLSLIYAINNFGRTRVYIFESLDNNYEVHGTLVKNNGYNIMALTKVVYVGNDDKFLKTIPYYYNYELFYRDIRVLIGGNNSWPQNKTKDDKPLNIHIQNTNFLVNKELEFIDDSDVLTLLLTYSDKGNKTNIIEIKFKLIQKYLNSFIV